MHNDETKTKFIELRAQHVPYNRISEQLGVSKPTLIQWARDFAPLIEDLQAAEREAVKEKLLGNFHDWLERQVAHFNRLDKEFGTRKLEYSPTESVFRMMMTSRQVLDKYLKEPAQPKKRAESAPQQSDPKPERNGGEIV